MKLKLRINSDDLKKLILFAIILLYLVSVAVVNIGDFLHEEEFSVTIIPLRAFSSGYIIPTIIFYLAALIAIITSVSSNIFEREKGGPGIVIGAKKEEGYSNWAKEKDMKNGLKLVRPSDEISEYGGIPLINNGKEIWVDNGEYHNLIIGSTGSGKTEMLVQPMVKILAKSHQSMIITDPKGEIYERNANELREKGYNVVLLNFRDPQRGNCWNPLALPYSLYKQGNPDKANELLDDLAMNILYDEKSSNADPFWEKTSADYFTGLALALFDDAKEEEINLNTINLMTTVGEDKFQNSTYIKKYFSFKDPASPACVNVSSTINAPSDTKGSILSVFKQKIKLFSSRENLSEMLSHSDFDMKEIGRKKTAVFIVVQDEKKTYHSLVTIFIKQVYETLIDVAQESGGKLPFRTNFILDEFANMPPLKDVTTMVTAARSRAIRFSFIIQNFAQLNQVYGKENGETIKGNCGNIVYLISSELAALEELSKLCGEKKSKEKEKTSSTPLATVSDLQRLPEWTIVVLRIRQMPFKTVLTPNFKLEQNNAWGKKYPKADYPSREKVPIQLFDIKKYVEDKTKDQFESMFGTGMGPGGMPLPPMFNGGGSGMLSMFGANSNPFHNEGSKGPGGINLDDLVKSIDAKIAELEEEEKREAEKQKEGQAKEAEFIEESDIDDSKSDELIKDSGIIDDSETDEELINDSNIVNDSDEQNNVTDDDEIDMEEVSDDEFFDDFFNDE